MAQEAVISRTVYLTITPTTNYAGEIINFDAKLSMTLSGSQAAHGHIIKLDLNIPVDVFMSRLQVDLKSQVSDDLVKWINSEPL